MPDPSSLRDSTQIVLPAETLEDLCADLERQFTETIVGDGPCRVIGSPVEIKKASDFLARNGVTLP
ncbi:VNG_1110C family protein [Salinarchaeum chitinilyticum]